MINYPSRKKSIKEVAQMNYMGIDHHKQCSHITLVGERGKEVKSGWVENLRQTVEAFLNGIESKIVAAMSTYG